MVASGRRRGGGRTCVEGVRVVVLAGRAEAHQAVICDLQDKAAVHHAVGRLEVAVAADVAVVQVVHSLVRGGGNSNADVPISH